MIGRVKNNESQTLAGPTADNLRKLAYNCNKDYVVPLTTEGCGEGYIGVPTVTCCLTYNPTTGTLCTTKVVADDILATETVINKVCNNTPYNLVFNDNNCLYNGCTNNATFNPKTGQLQTASLCSPSVTSCCIHNCIMDTGTLKMANGICVSGLCIYDLDGCAALRFGGRGGVVYGNICGESCTAKTACLSCCVNISNNPSMAEGCYPVVAQSSLDQLATTPISWCRCKSGNSCIDIIQISGTLCTDNTIQGVAACANKVCIKESHPNEYFDLLWKGNSCPSNIYYGCTCTLTYNPTTGVVKSNCFCGNATLASCISTTSSASNTNFNIVGVDSSTNKLYKSCGCSFTFNPNTGVLTAKTFCGNATTSTLAVCATCAYAKSVSANNKYKIPFLSSTGAATLNNCRPSFFYEDSVNTLTYNPGSHALYGCQISASSNLQTPNIYTVWTDGMATTGTNYYDLNFIGRSGNSSAITTKCAKFCSCNGQFYVCVGSSCLPLTACTGTVSNNVCCMSAVSHLNWGSNASCLATLSVLAYWNGRYNATGSNLAYYCGGAFGTMAKETAANYAKTVNYNGTCYSASSSVITLTNPNQCFTIVNESSAGTGWWHIPLISANCNLSKMYRSTGLCYRGCDKTLGVCSLCAVCNITAPTVCASHGIVTSSIYTDAEDVGTVKIFANVDVTNELTVEETSLFCKGACFCGRLTAKEGIHTCYDLIGCCDEGGETWYVYCDGSSCFNGPMTVCSTIYAECFCGTGILNAKRCGCALIISV